MSISLPEARQPYDGETNNGAGLFQLMDGIWNNNANSQEEEICVRHLSSLSITGRHFNLGRSVSGSQLPLVFSTYTRRKTPGKTLLQNPAGSFYAVDSREWQLIQPNAEEVISHDAVVLAIEKRRDHVPYERAIAAMRLTPYIYMTQFHPEADASGMLHYFKMPEKKQHVLEHHGDWKLEEMIMHLSDPIRYRSPMKLYYRHSCEMPEKL